MKIGLKNIKLKDLKKIKFYNFFIFVYLFIINNNIYI